MMKVETKRILKNHIQIILGVALYMVVTSVTGIGCPIRRIIHMPCPACGMTRSWLEVLQLNFMEAFEYHPLFIFLPLYVLICLHSDTPLIRKVPKWAFRTFAVLGAVLIFGVYIYRIIYGFGPV